MVRLSASSLFHSQQSFWRPANTEPLDTPPEGVVKKGPASDHHPNPIGHVGMFQSRRL